MPSPHLPLCSHCHQSLHILAATGTCCHRCHCLHLHLLATAVATASTSLPLSLLPPPHRCRSCLHIVAADTSRCLLAAATTSTSTSLPLPLPPTPPCHRYNLHLLAADVAAATSTSTSSRRCCHSLHLHTATNTVV